MTRLARIAGSELARSFERSLERDPRLAATGGELDVEAATARWRESSKRGDAVARLRIPSLGVDEVVVNGTDTASLKRGPGRYLDSAMPGEGELVYIAGHRTTYGAPFSRIDSLAKGDFFASHRWISYAKPVAITAPDATGAQLG